MKWFKSDIIPSFVKEAFDTTGTIHYPSVNLIRKDVDVDPKANTNTYQSPKIELCNDAYTITVFARSVESIGSVARPVKRKSAT